MIRRLTYCVAAVLAVGACSDQQNTDPTSLSDPAVALSKQSTSYVISLSSSAPGDLAAAVKSAGGTLKSHSKAAGVAVATSDAADFAAKLRVVQGVEAVGKDKVVQWIDPDMKVEELVVGGSDETFYPIQWAPAAIHADDAWEAGAFGEGARVAVLDGGIYSAHPDIAPNLDVARSRSFALDAAGNLTPYNSDLGTFWHGTHVAGIVAAADNSTGVIGIAPKATIIGVKVLHGGSGAFEWVINGIIYAATPVSEGGAGAHIINMSLGATFNRVDKDPITGENFTAENSHLINAVSKATSYARKRGVLVVVSAGNGGLNLDGAGSLVVVPAMSTGVLAISALGPEAWAKGATNFDDLASYSNHGSSLIAFGGPGGDGRYPGNENCTMPLVGGTITRPCWVFDLVISSSRGTTAAGGYSWAAGTSMSAPAASGVAALIVGKRGPMSPAALESALRKSADDLGKPGKDDVYGLGRINALRAVQ